MADDDDDADKGLAGLSPEFQAMVGGMAGHTASFAKLLEKRAAKVSKEAGKKKDDEEFFESYADLAIHEEMLNDRPRCEAYREAIKFHQADWAERGNVRVIDVGSGTGLLAVLCARANAHHVIAVEASRLAHFARQVVETNTAPGAVEVRECRAEELALEDDAKVDNMLPSVLAVRDRCLRQGGLMLPSRCRLLVAPLEDPAWRAARLGFWGDVQGVDMSCLLPLATATACEKPHHRLVPADGLLAGATEVLSLDLSTVGDGDLRRFEAALRFELPAGRRLDGFASWFECEFGAAGWLLSTSPSREPTHWRQTAFYLREPIEGGGGASVEGSVRIERDESYSRGYRVTFDIGAAGRKRRVESYKLG
ncbi:unnamed protein product [Prorocentrum cordatum]|uniref:Protein arginine N-methyltransferase domain-containing protein n=1 Tax=Prorocentrum cordatum TaxID=2364126 RepID=A0ABN9VKK8_9DINO|nr:unnamed protein product [Polarella glacialis]